MEDSFDDARLLISACRTILEDLGLRVTAASVASPSARAGSAGAQSKAAHLNNTWRRNMFGPS